MKTNLIFLPVILLLFFNFSKIKNSDKINTKETNTINFLIDENFFKKEVSDLEIEEWMTEPLKLNK